MRPPHTVIYTHGAGRLGNQVIRFAHWIAWAQAHPGEVEVCNFSFWPYARYFVTWKEHPGCVFPLRAGAPDRLARWYAALPRWVQTIGAKRSVLQRSVQAAGRWWPGGQALAASERDRIDLNDPVFHERVVQRRFTTCSGWQIANWAAVTALQPELRTYFKPAPAFEVLAGNFIRGLRAGHDVLIGVLIRQSDYQEWRGGRFYFPTEQYVDWMRQLLELHAGRRVAFVVASEARQDPALFTGLPCHFTTGSENEGGHWFESWVELSQCDLVVSPPSTFSATAAFLGGVPLWPLTAVGQHLAFGQALNDGLAGAAGDPLFSLSVK